MGKKESVAKSGQRNFQLTGARFLGNTIPECARTGSPVLSVSYWFLFAISPTILACSALNSASLRATSSFACLRLYPYFT